MASNSGNLNDKIKDFSSKVEGVASILGAYIEHGLKDKDRFDKQIKGVLVNAEKFIKDIVTQHIASRVSNFDLIQKVDLKIKKRENFKGDLPAYESELASGFDVRAQLEEAVTLKPGERTLIPTGLSFEIPKGYEIQARPRSGWAIKKGIGLVNSPGTIDADYRGEVKIIIINLGLEDVEVTDQTRIAQLVLCPVFQAEFIVEDELSSTDRGEGGFGSTGAK